METVLIAALVASIVSLLGLLVQLHIARRSQSQQSVQPLLQVHADDVARTIRNFRDMEQRAELFRIECWGLLSELTRIERTSNGLYRLTPELADSFLKKVAEYEKEGDAFLRAWADLKGDIPEQALVYASSLRHECRHQVHHLCNLLLELRESLTDRSRSGDIRKMIAHANESLRGLLMEVERFTQVLRTIRIGIFDPPRLPANHMPNPDARKSGARRLA